MINNKKPFGLTLACNIAAQAIKDNIAPTSVILSNLLFIQKEKIFPKVLDAHYFSVAKHNTTQDEKKVISNILNDLRSPHLNVSDLLEKYIKDSWVIKIPDFKKTASTSKYSNRNVKNNTTNSSFKKSGKKTSFKKKREVKDNKLESVIQKPIITIKKNKLN